jgi:hypothetical protein
MSFADERATAEAAMAHRGPGEGPPYPPVADRIRIGREQLGLGEQELERLVDGQGQHLCQDLEWFDREAFECASIGDLLALARALETSVSVLLFGDEPPAALAEVTCSRIADALRERQSRSGLSLEDFSTQVGWNVEPVLNKPLALLAYNLEGLRDICVAVGVDWLAVVMHVERTDRRAPSSVEPKEK